ncbi:hypothetical protein ASPCADRAFT_204674 [Aspergillus carbonarius ITEM 5010]|uniref:C2H2-type domain-containing protein n=1 Tax=Aspergillus carbonarius (strain ITEM 5010) TaxID=602072 RepID=A0A1R3RWX7_ASPC5|nr:hypothetical protein ASPCADRAFT_204674 [Aspergillus carbonarius ITEM 5010]
MKARLFCPVCQDSTFKNLEALRSHQTLLGHKLPCSHCNRRFVTSDALMQHVQVAHKQKHVFQTASSATAPATAVGFSIFTLQSSMEQKNEIGTSEAAVSTTMSAPLQVNDHSHIIPNSVEQEILFQCLLAQCHPSTRLITNGYTMSPTPTPESGLWKGVVRRDLFRHTPPPISDSSGYRRGRRAVVIDCEMVRVTRGRREIAFLAAIDFLTGEVLISQYVEPRYRVTSWDTKVSGITPSAMAAAIESGEALRGWLGARWALWEFVDSDTVLIGHALQNDLDTLGMIHSRVVDSSILTAEAVFNTLRPTEPFPRVWGLKALAGDMLARKIQSGRRGHRAVEDAAATRDVVMWCLKNPDLLNSWADNARSYYQMQEGLKKKAREKKAEADRKKENEKEAKEL